MTQQPKSWLFFPEDKPPAIKWTKVAHLTGKATSVLDLLMKRRGEVVEREEILRDVWKGIHVTPDLVREYVFDIRKALGDDPKAPIHIETIRGVGFRLIGGVDYGRPHRGPGIFEQRARIAVLRPLVHSADPRWKRLGDGFADDLITGPHTVSRISL